MVIAFAEYIHTFDHDFPVVDYFLLLLEHHVHEILVFLGFADQMGEAIRLERVFVGHILDGAGVDGYLANHFDLLAPAVVVHSFDPSLPRR